MGMLVSVIVPVYNVEKYLARCLDSIVGQSYRELEIILVNDGSQDNSLNICREYEKRDDRIIVIDKKTNEGLVRARKTGVAAANGPYITFVDSDDWVEDTHMEALITNAAGGADMVCSGTFADMEDHTEQWDGVIPEGVYEEVDLKTKVFPVMLCTTNYYENGILPNVWSKLFRREILQDIYPHVHDSITYGEDVAVTYPALLCCKKVVIIKKPQYHYCIRESSMSFDKNIRLCESLYYLNETLRYFFCRHELSNSLLEQLKYFIVHIEMHNLKTLYSINLKIESFAMVYPEISHKKIVVYGAGKFGKEYFWKFTLQEDVEVTLWVDKNYEKLSDKLYGLVKSPNCISEVEYDFIVVAINNPNTVMKIKNELMERGVPEDKILWHPIIRTISAEWV